jgi:hypothetical protein
MGQRYLQGAENHHAQEQQWRKVIEILDSDDEMPAKGKGKEKEPDNKDGDGNVLDS